MALDLPVDAVLFLYPEDYTADTGQDLFAPGTGTTVEGISELAVRKALSGLHIFKEVRKKNMR